MIDKIVAGMCVEQKIIQASWPQPDSRVGAVRGRFSRKLPMALTAELVERCERPEPDRGPDPNFTSITEQEREALIEQLVRELHAGPLWVFAYGSLIWKPIFISIEHFPATAYGWHRSFCLELRDLRGSPQQPGLMMALDRGGCCKGIVYRLSDANPRQQIGQLVHRELNSREGLHSVRWITAQAGSERIRALTFGQDLGVKPFTGTCHWEASPGQSREHVGPLAHVRPTSFGPCRHWTSSVSAIATSGDFSSSLQMRS